MGGLDVIIVKELKDLYWKLGVAVWCCHTTTRETQAHHKKKVKQWLALIDELHPIICEPNFSIVQFRATLYKHFTKEILDELPYVCDMSTISKVYEPAKHKARLKIELQKWLKG